MRVIREQERENADLIKKKNSSLFLARMKQLASLPELQNHKFIIPTQRLPYSQRVLTTEEIDRYIGVNRLIFKQEESIETGDSEANPSENVFRSEKTEFIRIDKKVKNVLFKVPDTYLKASELDDQEFNYNNESTGDSSGNENEGE